MTSLRQFEANRRNALRSTGPRTENGKQQSRRNVIKHGLTAESIELAHDPQAWQGCIGHERQAFPHEVVDHSQDPKPPAIGKCVRQEIQASAPIGPLQSNIVSRDQNLRSALRHCARFAVLARLAQ